MFTNKRFITDYGLLRAFIVWTVDNSRQIFEGMKRWRINWVKFNELYTSLQALPISFCKLLGSHRAQFFALYHRLRHHFRNIWYRFYDVISVFSRSTKAINKIFRLLLREQLNFYCCWRWCIIIETWFLPFVFLPLKWPKSISGNIIFSSLGGFYCFWEWKCSMARSQGFLKDFSGLVRSLRKTFEKS